MEYSFGTWVRRRRKALDLTQQELAARVGCSVSAIFKIEADERRPSQQIAGLLARSLEIPADQLPMFVKIARQLKSAGALSEIQVIDRPPGPAASSVDAPPGFLIGREVEMAEITRLLLDPQCRMLTLMGQGGIGKTHLALHTASRLAASPQQMPMTIVHLAPLSGREQVVTAIADGLGIVLYAASDRSQQLISFLSGKNHLLVLDNFEHLIVDPGCTGLVRDILDGAPGVKLLVTSRQPLQLSAEWVFEVQGLPVSQSASHEELKANSAVLLFLQCANRARVGFTPTGEELEAIARICSLVEGLPLGIELAAAWVRSLSCREIAAEIQQSLDFLAANMRDLPERHRSIRAAIDDSWNLLTHDERRILMSLAVFSGGFTRRAAEAVAHAGLADLLSLVSKSLVRRSGSARYDLHELIRQYALDMLRQDGGGYETALDRHSRYFAGLLDEKGVGLKSQDRPSVVAELVADLANLRQAWYWAVKNRRAAEIFRAADTLFWFYESRSNCREGVPLFQAAVDALQPSETEPTPGDHSTRVLALGRSLNYMGYFQFRQGRHPQGRDTLQTSMVLLGEIASANAPEVQAVYADTLAFLGSVVSVMGEFESGDQLLRQGLEIKQALNDRWGCAFCLKQLGLSACYRGDYSRSAIALEKSLEIGRETGNPWAVASSLNHLGIVAYAAGRHDLAQEHFADSLALSRLVEDRASVAAALDGLGMVHSAYDRHQEAVSLFQESIALLREIGEQGNLSQTLVHYGNTLLKANQVQRARKQYLEALRVAAGAEVYPVILDALLGEAEVRRVLGEPETAFVICSMICDHPSSPYETRLRAEEICRETGPEVVQEPVHGTLLRLVDEILADRFPSL